MVPPQSLRGEVFLSHASKVRRFVLRLVRVLKQHKVRYWYSATHIAGAKQWHDEIGRALARCNWFLVVLTRESVDSSWVKRELLFALNDARYFERIIPVIVKPCKYQRLSWTLAQFEFVDFTTDFDAGCRRLMEVWNLTYKSKSRQVRKNKKRKHAG